LPQISAPTPPLQKYIVEPSLYINIAILTGSTTSTTLLYSPPIDTSHIFYSLKMAGKQVEANILPTAATNDAKVNNGAKEETKKRQRINNGLLLVPTLLYRRAFYKYTWEPIQKIRQTKEIDKTLVSIVNFVEDKYAELQSVQVAVSTY
jgi:hypothetical protein